MGNVFLTGEWRKLIMVHYEVPPSLLTPYIPKGTVLNLFNGKCYVTLAAFRFCKIGMKGIKIPFHVNVTEVNFRFYVIPENESQKERGVVFIKEIVHKPFIAMAANLLYQEHYEVQPVRYNWNINEEHQSIEYKWKQDGWNSLKADSSRNPLTIQTGSIDDFLTFQPRGYTKVNEHKTFRYVVHHPLWQIYPIQSINIAVNFKLLFGSEFALLDNKKPEVVHLAEGSPISIMMRQRLSSAKFVRDKN